MRRAPGGAHASIRACGQARLARSLRARVHIDRMLEQAGWVVQEGKQANLRTAAWKLVGPSLVGVEPAVVDGVPGVVKGSAPDEPEVVPAPPSLTFSVLKLGVGI
jgi:hypothetical protein